MENEGNLNVNKASVNTATIQSLFVIVKLDFF